MCVCVEFALPVDHDDAFHGRQHGPAPRLAPDERNESSAPLLSRSCPLSMLRDLWPPEQEAVWC
jgi:hypothetical protein